MIFGNAEINLGSNESTAALASLVDGDRVWDFVTLQPVVVARVIRIEATAGSVRAEIFSQLPPVVISSQLFTTSHSQKTVVVSPCQQVVWGNYQAGVCAARKIQPACAVGVAYENPARKLCYTILLFKQPVIIEANGSKLFNPVENETVRIRPSSLPAPLSCEIRPSQYQLN